MEKLNKFVAGLVRESQKTETENGMVAYNTTQNACLDLFSIIGAIRTEKAVIPDVTRLTSKFVNAWNENPLLAMKILFYARDIREGLGERDIPKFLFTWLAFNEPESMLKNIELIPEYGRYDDWYAFIDTPIEQEMFGLMKNQFCKDIVAMHRGEPVSLLAKWIKTPDASSKTTRTLGIRSAVMMGYDIRHFKRSLRALRKHIDIVETHMSSKDYMSINYQNVPARAMFKHKDAFNKNDFHRYQEYINKVKKGEATIHADTLYPYDIVEEVFNFTGLEFKDVLEAQWKALPDYVDKGQNVLVMADTSGSMAGRPLYSAIGLALYFAERNTGAFENVFMTFSSMPEIVEINPINSLENKLKEMASANWGFSTNIIVAFKKVLDVAKKYNASPDDIPKAIIIISDMEFDRCDNTEWDLYDSIKEMYNKAGYDLPMIVFWNVESRHDTYHADAKRPGTILVSGQSVTTFKNLISSFNETPMEYMMRILNSERYAPITV